ncbi:hypothetical protein LguiA_012653 [Lonicera macranthoides]
MLSNEFLFPQSKIASTSLIFQQNYREDHQLTEYSNSTSPYLEIDDASTKFSKT